VTNRHASAALATLLVALALLGSGCARRMPVAELGEQGGNIGITVVTAAGETVVGRLLSLDNREIVVRVRRRETGEESVRRFSTEEVASATVHRTVSETSWGPVLSTVVGVAGGVLIAAALKGVNP
jgi:hypothetical protein